MSTQIIAPTRLDWRIASEEPDLDLDTDLYTCTACDGTLIAAPTADECNRQRREYEYLLAFRRFCKTEPGSPAQRLALDVMRQLRPTTPRFAPGKSYADADLMNESIEHGREHTQCAG